MRCVRGTVPGRPRRDLQGKRGRCAFSFDHLVGPSEDGLWNLDAKPPCRLQIDHKLDFHRLLHWKLGYSLTLQNTSRIHASMSVSVCYARAVAHEATQLGELTPLVSSRQSVSSQPRTRTAPTPS